MTDSLFPLPESAPSALERASDTPRSDAMRVSNPDGAIWDLRPMGMIVRYADCQKLERELNEARAEVARLERAEVERRRL